MNVEHLKTWLPAMCRRMAESCRNEMRQRTDMTTVIRNAMLKYEAELWDSLADPERSPTSVVHWALGRMWDAASEGGASLGRMWEAPSVASSLEAQIKARVACNVLSLLDQRGSRATAEFIVDKYDEKVTANRKQPRHYTVTGSRGDYKIAVYDWDGNIIFGECVSGATKQAVARWKKDHPSIMEK